MADTRPGLLPDSLRDDFPILQQTIRDGPRLVYLDNAATTQRPSSVIQSMVDVYEQDYANVHRGIHWLSDQSTDRYEAARETVRAFLNAPGAEQVIFTNGATAGINLVARSWGDQNVRENDEILVTEMEHHANLVPWHQLASRTGCRIRVLPITKDGLLSVDQLSTLLNERTRLVALTAASNVLGTITPFQQVIDAAHANGSIVMLDAAQWAPHGRLDVQALDADFVAFSGHKLMGPSGIGVLYGRRELLDAMPPFLGGGNMIRRVRIDGFEPADLPMKFEAGTPPIVPAIGLGAAIEYANNIGIDRIAAHERALTEYAHRRLESFDGLTFLGPPPSCKTGIVSFHIASIHAHDIAQLLDREGIAIRAGHHCTMPLHHRLGINASSRASFYLYNTLDEVDRLAEGLEKAVNVFRRGRK